jgi:hypothetical protein
VTNAPTARNASRSDHRLDRDRRDHALVAFGGVEWRVPKASVKPASATAM